MTPEKKLHHLKIILLALSITAVALIITALVLHSTNNMFTSSSELMKCAIVLNTTNKDKNISTLTIITTVMLIIGIVFSLTLAVFLVVWLIRKAGVKTSVPDKYRIPIYLLTALALLGTAISYGYYQSFLTQYGTLSCPAVWNSCIIQVILLAIAMGCLLACLILVIILPKHIKQQLYYEENKPTEIQLPNRTNQTQANKVIKIKLNDKSLNQFIIEPKQKAEVDESSDELQNKIGHRLLDHQDISNRNKPMTSVGNLTPAPNNILVPSFDQRKMEIVRQYRQSPVSRLHEPDELPISNYQPPSHNSRQQIPQPTPQRKQDYKKKSVETNDFVNKQRVTQKSLFANQQSNPLLDNLKRVDYENDIFEKKYGSPILTPLDDPRSPLRNDMAPLDSYASPSHNQLPGLVRSRKRIFDRTTDKDKETYLRNELRSKYGMK